MWERTPLPRAGPYPCWLPCSWALLQRCLRAPSIQLHGTTAGAAERLQPSTKPRGCPCHCFPTPIQPWDMSSQGPIPLFSTTQFCEWGRVLQGQCYR